MFRTLARILRQPSQRRAAWWLVLLFLVWTGMPCRAVVLWADLGSTLAQNTGDGTDILGGVVHQDNGSSGTLYFRFRISPLSDVTTEEFFAAFQFFEKGTGRLAVGNSLKAWAYSAFNTSAQGEGNSVPGDIDLRSMRPDPSASVGVPLPYELPRRGIENVIVIKVTFVPDADDKVVVWLNPDLSHGSLEADQRTELTTDFTANASFDELRIRHGGAGDGWVFSEMAVATAFEDFVSGLEVVEPDAGADSIAGHSPVTVRVWQREQGLPQNSVRALAQTREGYLWVAGEEGVSRFDGTRFVTYSTQDGLPAQPVQVLLADASGQLWAGTAGGGLAAWRDGRFTNYTTAQGLASDSILALAEDAGGDLWVGTDSGLSRIRSGKLATAGPEFFKGQSVTALTSTGGGEIVAAVRGMGLFRYTNDTLVPVAQSAAVAALLKDVHCLLEDTAGRIWVGAGDDIVLCRERDEWRRYRVPRSVRRPVVTSLVQAPDGAVWASSLGEGLIEFRNGKLAAFNASMGLSDNFVGALIVDQEGNLWVGTTAGLNRVRRSQLVVFGRGDGLGIGPIQGLAELAPGVVWTAKPGDGLFGWTGRSFTRIGSANALLRGAAVNSILVSSDTQCWVATTSGLMHFAEPLNREASPAFVVSGADVIAVLESRDQTIWIGARNGGLWHRTGGRWLPKSSWARSITCLAQGRDGQLWIGTDGQGVIPFDSGSAAINKGAGLLSDTIRTLYDDGAGTLWIGTAAGGLARWRDNRLSNFTTREGLPDNTISQIVEDDSGRLWVGSNRGLAGISKRELDDVAAGRAAALYPVLYGRPEGMPSEECTGGYSPAGMKTGSGKLWFATSSGIAVADPQKHQADAPPPVVRLEEVFIDGSAVEFRHALNRSPAPSQAEPLRIAPGKKRIEFHYAGLSFAAPDRVRFRYRLVGADPDWVEAGTRRSVFYGYLPPGDYRFEVKACSGAGAWNELALSLPLQVQRRFYQSYWFLGALAFGGILFAGAMARLVERRKHQARLRSLEQERAVARERARIAQDLHDDLGSSLTRISLLSDSLKEDVGHASPLEPKVARISQASAQTVRALEEIVWALRPGSDTVESLVEYISHVAHELFDGERTKCRLSFPSDIPGQRLPPEVRHNIFLVVKEALTNALKHARASEVVVQGEFDDGRLLLKVSDDGQGWNPDHAATHRNGLNNMRRRAEEMGGMLEVDSRPGAGTRVTLTVNVPGQAPILGKKGE
ncbi:MAG TPA: two-component regulator propeller domain-containing protein [Verrucomicrobiae bacterium]|nr:two-component regulator propeller domain-containing protein [Verrucomicrobiae bacterium]